MGGRSSSFRHSGGSAGGIGSLTMNDNDTVGDLFGKIFSKRQKMIDVRAKEIKYHSNLPLDNSKETNDKRTKSILKAGEYSADINSLEEMSDHVMALSRSAGNKTPVSEIRRSNNIPDRLHLSKLTNEINNWNAKHKRK